MKKILFAIAFVMMMVVGANAQNDNWFRSNDDIYNNRPGGDSENPNIVFPGSHEISTDANGVPLGTGLLILTALGAGYAVARKKRQ